MSPLKFSFNAIGTAWSIECFETDPEIKNRVSALVQKRIEDFDKTYSRFRTDSLIYKAGKNKGTYILPKDSKEIFALYNKLYKITDGKFTFLVGSLLEELGYDSKYSLKPKEIHKLPKAEEMLSFKYPKLLVKKPFMLDFGAAGKGYLIDIIGDLLEQEKISSFLIEAGGDILYKAQSDKPLRVGLENPSNPKQVIGVTRILNQSICASSGNRRKWDKYHHIVNPDTLGSAENVLATWVVAEKTVTADALATSLFLVEPQALLDHFKFEYLILYPDFSINKSDQFPGELFFKNENH